MAHSTVLDDVSVPAVNKFCHVKRRIHQPPKVENMYTKVADNSFVSHHAMKKKKKIQKRENKHRTERMGRQRHTKSKALISTSVSLPPSPSAFSFMESNVVSKST